MMMMMMMMMMMILCQRLFLMMITRALENASRALVNMSGHEKLSQPMKEDVFLCLCAGASMLCITAAHCA
jgi:asparagine N-glycosylation enzyme membrane subunit Stt3